MKLGKSQVVLLNDHLRGTGRTINSAQALKKFGIVNLTARLSDLRSWGLVVNRIDTNTYVIPSRDIFGSRGKTFA